MPPKMQGNVAKMNSLVQPVDSSGVVFRGFYIWTSRAPAAVADADMMFAKCLVLPGSTAVSQVVSLFFRATNTL